MKGNWKIERTWKDIMFPETGDGYKAIDVIAYATVLIAIIFSIFYFFTYPIEADVKFSVYGDTHINFPMPQNTNMTMKVTHAEGEAHIRIPSWMLIRIQNIYS